MNENNLQKNTTAQFLIFTAETGNPKIEVRVEGEMVWLTQKLIAELFDVSIPTINEHLRNIYTSKELLELVTIRKFLIVQNEGEREVSREIEHYNLDVIIAVGYRVNSNHNGVSFLGAFIKPYRIYVRNRIKGNFYIKIKEWNQIFTQNTTDFEERYQAKFLASLNSYLGIMSHFNTFKLRKKMITEYVSINLKNLIHTDDDFCKIFLKKSININHNNH